MAPIAMGHERLAPRGVNALSVTGLVVVVSSWEQPLRLLNDCVPRWATYTSGMTDCR